LLEPELRTLEGPVDPVEQFGDMTSIWIGFVERVREERARERGRVDRPRERTFRNDLATRSASPETLLGGPARQD
jgi:hypothetical protein